MTSKHPTSILILTGRPGSTATTILEEALKKLREQERMGELAATLKLKKDRNKDAKNIIPGIPISFRGVSVSELPAVSPEDTSIIYHFPHPTHIEMYESRNADCEYEISGIDQIVHHRCRPEDNVEVIEVSMAPTTASSKKRISKNQKHRPNIYHSRNTMASTEVLSMPDYSDNRAPGSSYGPPAKRMDAIGAPRDVPKIKRKTHNDIHSSRVGVGHPLKANIKTSVGPRLTNNISNNLKGTTKDDRVSEQMHDHDAYEWPHEHSGDDYVPGSNSETTSELQSDHRQKKRRRPNKTSQNKTRRQHNDEVLFSTAKPFIVSDSEESDTNVRDGKTMMEINKYEPETITRIVLSDSD